jgi:hypothetical protein
MLKVAVTTDILQTDWEKLCPARQLRWGRCEFLINPPAGTVCDYWIVYCGSRPDDRMVCAPANTLFIAGEPPSKKIYPRGYYAQFHRIISTRADDPHPRVTATALGLPWHVGLELNRNRYLYGYDELKTRRPEPKQNKISVVCSALRATAGQRERLDFLDFLKQRLGDRLVHFGRGFTAIDDKMEAIAPYRLHLVLENSRSEHYWTEKLADAYLGWAFPVYLGCPNLGDYFPAESFAPISIEDREGAAALIEKLLATPSPAETETIIGRCRDLVLDTYNPFARFAHWAEMFHQPLPSRTVIIHSHKAFRPFPSGLFYRLRRWLADRKRRD